MVAKNKQQDVSIAQFDELKNFIIDLGFDGVLYSFYSRPMYANLLQQPLLYFSEGFADFVPHYIEQGYGNRDFVIRLAFNGGQRSIDWWHEINSGNVADNEREVTIDARDNFGIYNGISIPVLDGTYAIAGISVISKNPSRRHFCKLKDKHAETLLQYANQYHSSVIQSKRDLCFFVRPLLDNLTDTKKKVLRHLITGRSMDKIGQYYDISAPYAEKVLRNIRKEFGEISTNELLYILGKFSMEEVL